MIRLAIGAALAAGVALAAYRARALSLDGAIAAFVVGTIVVDAGGWSSAAVLLAFFVPSALLTRLGRERKRSLRGTHEAAPRNAWQVLANGGVATLCAIAAVDANVPFSAAFAGAFAAASADTWGTEIGTLARRRPVSILTFRPMEPGLSGGVSLLGTVRDDRRRALRRRRRIVAASCAVVAGCGRRRRGRAARLAYRRKPSGPPMVPDVRVRMRNSRSTTVERRRRCAVACAGFRTTRSTWRRRSAARSWQRHWSCDDVETTPKQPSKRERYALRHDLLRRRFTPKLPELRTLRLGHRLRL